MKRKEKDAQEMKLREVVCGLIYHGRRFYNSQRDNVDDSIIKKAIVQINNILRNE